MIAGSQTRADAHHKQAQIYPLLFFSCRDKTPRTSARKSPESIVFAPSGDTNCSQAEGCVCCLWVVILLPRLKLAHQPPASRRRKVDNCLFFIVLLCSHVVLSREVDMITPLPRRFIRAKSCEEMTAVDLNLDSSVYAISPPPPPNHQGMTPAAVSSIAKYFPLSAVGWVGYCKKVVLLFSDVTSI